MRKHRSRRKNATPNSNGNGIVNVNNNNNNNGHGSHPPPIPVHPTSVITESSTDDRVIVDKKPISPEEASLTAKNYRLAKELVSRYFL